MCAHYLESTIDSILVCDDGRPVGIVGGYDLLDHMRKNPTRDFQYTTNVEQIMLKDLPVIDNDTKFGGVMSKWKATRSAFAYLPDEHVDHLPLSTRKMLEVGMRTGFRVNISSMPRKKIATFNKDDAL